MDGARLWEVGPYYNKSYKEIAKVLNSSNLLETFPLVPQSNMVHVLFKEEYKSFLFHNRSSNEYLDSNIKSKAELHIGDYSLEYPIDLLKSILTKYF